MKTKFNYFIALILVVGLFHCSTPSVDDIQPEEITDVTNLKVPDGFVYKTNKTLTLDIKMPTSIEFDSYRSRFEIYSDAAGEHLLSGSFDANGQFNEEMTVPMTLDKLYFKSRVTDSLIPLSSTFTERETVTLDLREFYEEEMDSFPIEEKPSDKIFASRSSNGLINGDFTLDDFGTVGGFGKFTPAVEKWNMVEKRKVEKMTWYSEDGNGFIGTTDEGQHKFGIVQTIAVNPGDVIDFSAMAKSINDKNINCVLRLSARNDNGKIKRRAKLRFRKPSYEWTTKNIVMTMPRTAVYLTVEAVGKDRTKNGRVVLDNFLITGITDSDNDGVEDEYDDYPNDANKTVDSYYPSEESFATLAFEDNWPGRGDYDFNDLVVDYQFKQELNADNEMLALEVDFKFKAVGASNRNGFGFEMDISPDLVESVTGSKLTEGYISVSSNGTESGQSNATIIVTDNAFNVLNHPGGMGINTTPGNTYVEPKSVNIRIVFKEPVSPDDAGYAPYNPFMIINAERGREVHLPGYPPTDLADATLFGTMNDDTDLGLGKYYLTENNLPWGINLPTSFDYPIEGAEILEAYNHFGQWAQSRGFSFMDWYYTRSGYRNTSKIYSK